MELPLSTFAVLQQLPQSTHGRRREGPVARQVSLQQCPFDKLFRLLAFQCEMHDEKDLAEQNSLCASRHQRRHIRGGLKPNPRPP
jgi:hypothetical protein